MYKIWAIYLKIPTFQSEKVSLNYDLIIHVLYS